MDLVADQNSGGDGNGGNAPSARPEYLPETYWDTEKNSVKAEDLTRDLSELPTLREFKTAADTRAAAIPKTADDYKIELPADFQLPEGTKFIADPKDPLVVGVRTYAKEHGLDQAAVTDLTKMWAGMLASEHSALKAAETEQMKALGDAAQDRIKAANTWLTGQLKPEQVQAIAPALRTKAGVEAVEALITKFSGLQPRGDLNGGSQPDKTPSDEKKLKAMYPSMAAE